VHRRAQRGFSLIEMLLALFVVVVITSLVSLGVNSGSQDIQLEAKIRSLADISSYALDEAQMSGVDRGLLLSRSSDAGDTVYRYSWLERRLEGWREPQLDAQLFAGGVFPREIELQLVLEDLPVAELAPDSAEEPPVPQVVFYASGETSPGFIELRDVATGELLWLLEWDLLGRFTLAPRGEAPDRER
jgi:general secretion pathway protein H